MPLKKTSERVFRNFSSLNLGRTSENTFQNLFSRQKTSKNTFRSFFFQGQNWKTGKYKRYVKGGKITFQQMIRKTQNMAQAVLFDFVGMPNIHSFLSLKQKGQP
jgi:hypothetical protein